MRSRTEITLATVAALALGGTTVAYGHEEGWGHAPVPPTLGMPLLDNLFERADADHDGKLTKAELDAFAADALKRFDKDGDGRLSLDEFQGLWLELTRPLEVRAFQFLDRNGEGKVTAQELQRPLDRFFEHLDRKGAGYVTEDELRGRERHHGPGDEGEDDGG
jgi:hypothetical protein